MLDRGGSYEWQGKFVVGQTSTKGSTTTFFDDSNRVISLVDTIHSQSTFTELLVDSSLTTFNMTNIQFLSLGTNNPGRVEWLSSDTTGYWSGVTFDAIDATIAALCSKDAEDRVCGH